MVRKSEDHIIEFKKMFGGDGEVQFKRIIETPDELYGKGRVFSVVTLNKDCEIAWHIHKGDGEYFHILSGEGQYSDNGSTVTVCAGDTTWTADGEGHSLKNLNDEPLVMIALVVYN